MKIKLVAWIGMALFSLASSCRDGEVRTWTVASQTRACTGVGRQVCYMIREKDNEPWQYFYDAIDGFDYRPGYEYTLSVRVRRVENPPMDASDLSYELVEILRQEKKESEGLPPERDDL